MRSCSRLNDKLHIGDQVLQIDHKDVHSLAMVQRFFRQPRDEMVELVLRRLPLANVYAITRHSDRQTLGIKRKGGSSEVRIYVDLQNKDQ